MSSDWQLGARATAGSPPRLQRGSPWRQQATWHHPIDGGTTPQLEPGDHSATSPEPEGIRSIKGGSPSSSPSLFDGAGAGEHTESADCDDDNDDVELLSLTRQHRQQRRSESARGQDNLDHGRKRAHVAPDALLSAQRTHTGGDSGAPPSPVGWGPESRAPPTVEVAAQAGEQQRAEPLSVLTAAEDADPWQLLEPQETRSGTPRHVIVLPTPTHADEQQQRADDAADATTDDAAAAPTAVRTAAALPQAQQPRPASASTSSPRLLNSARKQPPQPSSLRPRPQSAASARRATPQPPTRKRPTSAVLRQRTHELYEEPNPRQGPSPLRTSRPPAAHLAQLASNLAAAMGDTAATPATPAAVVVVAAASSPKSKLPRPVSAPLLGLGGAKATAAASSQQRRKHRRRASTTRVTLRNRRVSQLEERMRSQLRSRLSVRPPMPTSEGPQDATGSHMHTVLALSGRQHRRQSRPSSAQQQAQAQEENFSDGASPAHSASTGAASRKPTRRRPATAQARAQAPQAARRPTSRRRASAAAAVPVQRRTSGASDTRSRRPSSPLHPWADASTLLTDMALPATLPEAPDEAQSTRKRAAQPRARPASASQATRRRQRAPKPVLSKQARALAETEDDAAVFASSNPLRVSATQQLHPGQTLLSQRVLQQLEAASAENVQHNTTAGNGFQGNTTWGVTASVYATENRVRPIHRDTDSGRIAESETAYINQGTAHQAPVNCHRNAANTSPHALHHDLRLQLFPSSTRSAQRQRLKALQGC